MSAKPTRIIILMGVMGSGKTRIGKRLAVMSGWPFYDGDDFHPPQNIEKMRAGLALTDADRLPWLLRLKTGIDNILKSGRSGIFACSALKQAYRDLLGVDQKQVVTVFLKGDCKLIKQRLSGRKHAYMPDDLLKSQFETLENPHGGLQVDIALTPEEIVKKIMTFFKIVEVT